MLLSISPLEFHSSWKCETCSVTLSSNKVAVIQRAITQELSRLNLKCPTNIMLFIQNNKLAADSNHTIIQFKYVLIKLLGHANGYEWPSRISITIYKKIFILWFTKRKSYYFNTYLFNISTINKIVVQILKLIHFFLLKTNLDM